MGMPEEEFWASTPRYFAARQKAFIEMQQREWERARFVGWISIMPHLDPKRRVRITDVCRFEWEKVLPQFDPQTREERQRFHEDALTIFEKHFGLKRPEPNTANADHQ